MPTLCFVVTALDPRKLVAGTAQWAVDYGTVMSSIKGVYKCGKKWKSQIQVNGKQVGLVDYVDLPGAWYTTP